MRHEKCHFLGRDTYFVAGRLWGMLLVIRGRRGGARGAETGEFELPDGVEGATVLRHETDSELPKLLVPDVRPVLLTLELKSKEHGKFI